MLPVCNEMKRNILITHERIESLTEDVLVENVRSRTNYAFLIIRPE